jgi:hypothetical protein
MIASLLCLLEQSRRGDVSALRSEYLEPMQPSELQN